MGSGKIKILVVEDSPVVQMLMVHLFKMDPDFEVVGMANDGTEGVEKSAQLKPDVILMDIQMPRMNGYEATRRIMATDPVPIVICSAHQPEDVNRMFQAMEAGAVACADKPVGIGHPDFPAMAKNLVQTVKLMSQVRVVRRDPPPGAGSGTRPVAPSVLAKHGIIRLVAMGASTGGPVALQTILKQLPRQLPVPILVVQHISSGFVGGMAQWLRDTTGWPVSLAENDRVPEPGHVYLAPDDCHMGVVAAERLLLSKGPPENGVRPAISFLFRTVAEVYGAGAVGVILSGMGRDGADEFKLMRDRGAVTIVQNEETSVVHGMPGEAIRIGGAMHVLPPVGISDLLATLTRQS
jgi:two-component system chemotaxis response regulator CheB